MVPRGPRNLGPKLSDSRVNTALGVNNPVPFGPWFRHLPPPSGSSTNRALSRPRDLPPTARSLSGRTQRPPALETLCAHPRMTNQPPKTRGEPSSRRSSPRQFCGSAAELSSSNSRRRTGSRHALRFLRRPCSVVTTVNGFREPQRGETHVDERRKRGRRAAADDRQ